MQEYDIEISHISGTQNCLADIMSRIPAGLTPEKIKQLTRPRNIMVATVKLSIDSQVKKELRELAAFQDKDPYIKTWRDHITNQSAEVQDRWYAVLDGVVHFKNHTNYPFCRPVLPSRLENKVIKFVHFSLGHAGSEKFIAEIAHASYIKNLGRKVRKIFVLL